MGRLLGAWSGPLWKVLSLRLDTGGFRARARLLVSGQRNWVMYVLVFCLIKHGHTLAGLGCLQFCLWAAVHKCQMNTWWQWMKWTLSHQSLWRPVFFPLCSLPQPRTRAFEHAELNSASCSNRISRAWTQVLHWSHAPLDWVIQPALHFIVYTPRNGGICKKANKNIPWARYAAGISSHTPGYDSLSALVCFSQKHSPFRGRFCTTWMVLCFELKAWHWKHGSLKTGLIFTTLSEHVISVSLGNALRLGESSLFISK